MGRRRNIETAGMDKGTLKIVVVALGHTCGVRVQAPFGARVLSFVCCAPNDGFRPQSGLVQRGILYAAARGSENLYDRPASDTTTLCPKGRQTYEPSGP